MYNVISLNTIIVTCSLGVLASPRLIPSLGLLPWFLLQLHPAKIIGLPYFHLSRTSPFTLASNTVMIGSSKTVAVIGAGPAGLTTARSMIASNLLPTIFDIKPEVGGLWSTSSAPGTMGLNMEMKTNVSRYTCSFSDLAWPKDSSMFPIAKDLGGYLKRYQEKYIPHKLLKLGCEVKSVARGGGGRWKVKWKNRNLGDEEFVEEFDFVAICSGFFSAPYIPPISGLGGFHGDVLHTSEYSSSRLDLTGKTKIVVVGGSLSGAEVASNLALRISSLPRGEAEKVEIIHLISRPFWILPTYLPVPNPKDTKAPRFFPVDLVINDFNKFSAQSSQPVSPNDRIKSILGNDQRDIHSTLHITDEYFNQHPWAVMSDSYANFVRDGVIKPINGNLSAISLTTPKTLILGPETTVREITGVDTIILATGYHPTSSLQSIFPEGMFSSFTSSVSPIQNPNFLPLLLYKQCLHPAFENTGGFVGMYKGPTFSVMELQGRWLAGLFSGKLDWPTYKEMKHGIEGFGVFRYLRDTRDGGFRPQCSSNDIGLINDLRSCLGISSPLPVTKCLLNPMIPARFVDKNSDVNEANITLSSLSELINPNPTSRRVPPFLAKAIFRSLQGKWKLSKQIDPDELEVPSTIFTRSVEFRPREPTFTPSPRLVEESGITRSIQDRNLPYTKIFGGEGLEYLYLEQEECTAHTGSTMAETRRYIYRYHPDEDVITVWFVKPDSTDVDYLFHEFRVLEEQENEALYNADGMDLKCGWKAEAMHSTRGQDYPSYRFVFKENAGDLECFSVGYKASGVHKGSIGEGQYRRV